MMLFQIARIFIDVVTPVFTIVLIGYIAAPRLELKARTLSRTAYFILIPCFVFGMLSNVQISLSTAGQMIAFASITHIGASLFAYAIARLLKCSREMTAAFVMIAAFGNIGNLGLSLIEFRLGQAAQVSATIYFVTIVLVSFVISVGAASRAKGGGLAAVLSVFKTPALIAMVPALFFYGTEFEPPLFLVRITGLLGRAAIPMMLLILGVQLSEIKKFRFDYRVIVASGIRLIIAPLIAFGLTTFLSLSPIEISTGILQAGMPVAVLISIIAIEHDVIPEFVTTTVMFSTIMSLFTLTILLYLV